MLGTFIQTYDYWILIGVAFIFMLRMHGGGMHKHGDGESDGSHDAHTTQPTPVPESAGAAERPPAPDAARPVARDAKR